MAITPNEMLFKNLTELRSTDSGTVTTVENFKVITTEDDYDLIDEKTPDEVKHDREEARKSESTYLQKYASFENLAQNLAYDNSLQWKKDGESITVTETDGREVKYYVRRLYTQNAGLVAHVLTPVDPTTSFDVKVLFQGTDPGSFASIRRDAEANGAGAESFEQHKFTLLRQVNEIIMEKNLSRLPATMTVAGHSLGGADTQNFATAVMDTVVNNGSLYPELATIQKLNIFTANSAGVPQATADHAAKLASDIAELRKDGKTNLTIESYNKRVGGDGIQQTGEAHILSNVPSEHAKVDVLKAHIGNEKRNLFGMESAIGVVAAGAGIVGLIGATAGAAVVAIHAYMGANDTAKAHTEVLFKKDAIQATYDRLSNATPEGQLEVHKQLGKKSAMLNAIHKVTHLNFSGALSDASVSLSSSASGALSSASGALSSASGALSSAWKRVTNTFTQPNVGDAPTISPFLISKAHTPVVEPKIKPQAEKKGWRAYFGF